MVLKLEVILYKGSPPPQPISAEFGSVGGGIGRGDANALVLPDAERYISRTHAKIVFRTGRYFIEDHGSSAPVLVNGRTLGKGVNSPLADGDQITIGEYVLRATLAAVVPPSLVPSDNVASAAPKDDPLAFFGSGGTDPFGAVGQIPVAEDPFGMQAPKGAVAIPEDFDPFANLGSPQAPAENKGSHSDTPDLGLGLAPSNSLDQLFGLGTPKEERSPLFDPLGVPQDAAPLDLSPSLDPLAAFDKKPHATSAPQRNDVPELKGSYTPPKAYLDPALDENRAPGARADQPENMILSWDQDGSASGEIKTVIVGSRKDQLPSKENLPPRMESSLPPTAEPAFDSLGASAPNSLESALPQTPEQDAGVASAAAAQSPPTSARPTAGTSADVFVRAFLEGAGIADSNIPFDITPQTMHMLGKILRESMQGTLDLLLARATLKREIRAEVTMIAAKENNPLKFSPNVEAALAHLLVPQRGFMPPLEAIKDAHDDLRAHQFAFMAGMRAALAGVLRRFDPEQLEQRVTQKTVLDSLLPMNRRAKVWDLFVALYGEISAEAVDDFHSLFGREFLRAYEAQIAQFSSPQEGKVK